MNDTFAADPPGGLEPAAPRELGPWSATALVVSHTIGVGIYLTPAELIGALASPAWTFGVWLTCGAAVLAGAWTFGELASRFPQAGGLYVYLREAWGERVAFLYGWQSVLVMDPGITAALAAGLSQYLVVAWPAAAGRGREYAVGAVWVLALINMAGLKLGARVLNVLTAVKVLALAAVVAVALVAGAGSWSHFVPFFARRPGSPPIAEALAFGLVGAFYSFGGFWEVSRVAGETREPRRTVPRALAFGVVLVTLMYLVTTLAFLYLVPADQATSASAFAQRAGLAMLGRSGPGALAAVVVLSVVASVMALLLMAPRLYFAMGRDGVFPAGLARIHPVTKAPVRATVLLASIATVYVFSGTFREIMAFFMCTVLVFIALAAAALLAVRRRAPGPPQPGVFGTPAYPAAPALFILIVLAAAGGLVAARPVPALAGLVLTLLGLPAYGLFAPRPSVGNHDGQGGLP